MLAYNYNYLIMMIMVVIDKREKKEGGPPSTYLICSATKFMEF